MKCIDQRNVGQQHNALFLVYAMLSDGSSFAAQFVDVGDALQTVSRLRRLKAEKLEMKVVK